jgi:hypothetical protein
VFVHRPIIETSIEQAIRHGNQESGTLVLGHLVEGRTNGPTGQTSAWAVVITEQVPVPDGQATTSSFTFPPESFRQARQLADLRTRGESVVGSEHSHGWRCHECPVATPCEIRNLFFSAHDDRMAQQFPVYGAFLVVGGDPERDRDRPVVNCYVRIRGAMQAVPFGIF